MKITPATVFFLFDIESLGLHGPAVSVGFGLYGIDGMPSREAAMHVALTPELMAGVPKGDLEWCNANLSVRDNSTLMRRPKEMRATFWGLLQDAKQEHGDNLIVAAECPWPVEGRFLNACIDDHIGTRRWQGPYPLLDVSSIMLMAGMDPMATYDRLDREMPPHEPLADTRLTARLLARAIEVARGAGLVCRAEKPELVIHDLEDL